MNEIRYETNHQNVDYKLPTVFLAGPTVRGNQTHLRSWRFLAVELFKQKHFTGNLIIPEFTSPVESDKYRYDIPVWEYEGLCKSGVILVWLPRTRELIGLTTNCEFGYWLAKDPNKMVYGRPDDAYRVTYLDIMWAEHHKAIRQTNSVPPIYNTLEKTVNGALDKLFL